jgi:hypothetical protein
MKIKNKYIMLCLGRYPVQLNEVIKGLMIKDTAVRYHISPKCVAVMFTSSHDFHPLDEILKNVMVGRADNYILIKMSGLSKHFYSLNMNIAMFRALFSPIHPDYVKSPVEMLDEMQGTMNVLQKSTDKFSQIVSQVQQELLEEIVYDENVTQTPASDQESPEQLETEINRILDKINISGYDSLTESEISKLNKYAK